MTINEKFDQTLLDKIKEAKIIPRPRWQFLIKNYVFWFFGILSLVLGSLAMALIIYMVRSDDWRLYGQLGRNPVETILLLMPFFWIICLIFLIIIVYYEFKKTKTGYRYPSWLIILVSIGISIIFGGVFYISGFSQKIDDILGRHAPFYENIINQRLRFWSNPAEGRLSGMIKSQLNKDQFVLVDMDHLEWDLHFSNSNSQLPSVQVGRPARFLGKQKNEKEFWANEVLPLMPGREFFRRNDMSRVQNTDQKASRESVDILLLLEKYPDLKASFITDLSSRALIDNDPQILLLLKFLQASTGSAEFGH